MAPGVFDIRCVLDVDKIVELLLNFDFTDIKSKLPVLTSDLLSGIQNRFFVLYLIQFDSKERLKVIRNIVSKCFCLVNGDFLKCQQMIRQLSSEIMIQPNKTQTNMLINDDELGMDSSVVKIVERNLEELFRMNSSEDKSLKVKKSSDCDEVSKHDKHLSKPNSSNCKDQSHKKKDHHHRKSGREHKKTDINTANNGENVIPVNHKKKVAHPRNCKSCEETLVPTLKTLHSNISNNEQTSLSKTSVHVPKRKKTSESKSNTKKTSSRTLETSNQINNKKSVHTPKEKRTAASRNGTIEKTSSNGKTHGLTADTLSLPTSGIKRNNVDKTGNEIINHKRSASSDNSVHAPKKMKLSETRNGTNEETRFSTITTRFRNETSSEDKHVQQKDEPSNSYEKSVLTPSESAKKVQSRNDTSSNQTCLDSTNIADITIFDDELVEQKDEPSNSYEKSVLTPSESAKKVQSRNDTSSNQTCLDSTNIVDITISDDELVEQPSTSYEKSVLTPSKNTKKVQSRNDTSSNQTCLDSTNIVDITNSDDELVEQKYEQSNSYEKSVLTPKSAKKVQSRNDTSSNQTCLDSTNIVDITNSDDELVEQKYEPSTSYDKSVLTPSKSTKKLQSRNNTSSNQTCLDSTIIVDITNSDDELVEQKYEQSTSYEKSVLTPSESIKITQSRNDTSHKDLRSTNCVDLTIYDDEFDEINGVSNVKKIKKPVFSEKTVHSSERTKIAQSGIDVSDEKTLILTATVNSVDLTTFDDEHDGIKNVQSDLSQESVHIRSSEEKINDLLSCNGVPNLIDSLQLANEKDSKEDITRKYNIFKTIVYEHFALYDSKLIEDMSNLLQVDKQHLKFDNVVLEVQNTKFKTLFDLLIQIINVLDFKRIIFIGCLVSLFRNVVNTNELSCSDESHSCFLKFSNTIRKCKNEDFWTSWLCTGWDDSFFGGCVIIDHILYDTTSCKLIHPAVNWSTMPSFQTLFYTNYHNWPMCLDHQNKRYIDNKNESELTSIICSADLRASNQSSATVPQTSETIATKLDEIEQINVLPSTSDVRSDTSNERVPVQTAGRFLSSHYIVRQLAAGAPKYSREIGAKKVASTVSSKN